MLEFPFSATEWAGVQAASLALTNAVLADDEVLAESLRCELREVLDALRRQHGDHPVLRETEADFENSPQSQVDLYSAALKLAVENRLPTLSIRLSLASVLIELGDRPEARRQLEQCQAELPLHGDEDDRQAWTDLFGRCGTS